jgi:hypothetical protein
MGTFVGRCAAVFHRMPRYTTRSREVVRAAPIVASEEASPVRAGAVVVALDHGQRYRITVGPKWWQRYAFEAEFPGALLVVNEEDGTLSVSPPGPFLETATLIPENVVDPWQGR